MSRDRICVVATALLLSGVAIPVAASARGARRGHGVLDASAACAGVTEDAVARLRPETVESVSPLYQNTRYGKQLSGANMTVRAEPGLTAEQLQQALQCQIARCATHPASESCPLAVQGVRARVQAAGGKFAVQLWSDYMGAGREILARSQALHPGR